MTVLLAVLGLVFGAMAFAVPATAAAASTDCTSRGYDFLAEIQVSGENHVYDWTYGSPVDAAVVKAANAYKVFTYDPAVTSGTVDSYGLENDGGQEPAISHVALCTTRTEPVPTSDQFCVFEEEVWSQKQFFGFEGTDDLTWTVNSDGTGSTLGAYDALGYFDRDGSNCEQVQMVDICHIEGNGTYHLLNVAEEAVQAHLDHGDVYPTDGVCPTVIPFQETVKATASTWICLNETGPTKVEATGSGVTVGPQATPITDQQREAARTQDQSSADAALAATLASPAYSGYTLTTPTGVCTSPPPPPPTPPTPPTTPETVTAVAPATVEVPETVAVPAPATVPVPAKVTLPARIPAGEGSTTPIYALALLVLGATALAATTVHLVRTTR